jgi:hypothetical protein
MPPSLDGEFQKRNFSYDGRNSLICHSSKDASYQLTSSIVRRFVAGASVRQASPKNFSEKFLIWGTKRIDGRQKMRKSS